MKKLTFVFVLLFGGMGLSTALAEPAPTTNQPALGGTHSNQAQPTQPSTASRNQTHAKPSAMSTDNQAQAKPSCTPTRTRSHRAHSEAPNARHLEQIALEERLAELEARARIASQEQFSARLTQPSNSARTVQYHTQDIVIIHAKVNFTSLIILPATEEILDAATGDKDFWIIDVVHNYLFVHPAKENIESNLNLVTNKGNVYSFVLSDMNDSAPTDLRVIVQPADQSSIIASSGPAQFVPAEQVVAANEAVAAVQKEAVAAVDAYKANYPSKLVMDYQFKRGKKPFYVDSIYHDDKFTYLKVDARNHEKFALYEIRDGKPDLITYDLKDGVYVITHIVDKGYIRVGKKQMNFGRKG